MSLTELKENLKKISFVRWIIVIFILIDCHENKFNILSTAYVALLIIAYVTAKIYPMKVDVEKEFSISTFIVQILDKNCIFLIINIIFDIHVYSIYGKNYFLNWLMTNVLFVIIVILFNLKVVESNLTKKANKNNLSLVDIRKYTFFMTCVSIGYLIFSKLQVPVGNSISFLRGMLFFQNLPNKWISNTGILWGIFCITIILFLIYIVLIQRKVTEMKFQ